MSERADSIARVSRKTPSLPTPVRFLLAGGAAAVANFASRLLFSLIMPYAVAVTVAFFVGLATAFALNRRFVFRHSTVPVSTQAMRFVAVNMLGLLQTLLVSVALAEWLLPAAGLPWHREEIAHAIGIAVPVFTSYLAHRAWTFR